MSILEHKLNRRSMLKGVALGGLAVALRPRPSRAHAQAAAAAIIGVAVDRVPAEHDDPLWDRAPVSSVALLPQNIAIPGVDTAATKSMNVQALYDPARLAFLLSWSDAKVDTELGTVLQYRDGVALQFPEDPVAVTPSFMMGQAGGAVVIYHWKSDWQFGPAYDVEEAHPNMYYDLYPYSGRPAGEMAEAADYMTRGRKEYLTAAAAGNALADPLVQAKIGPVQKMRAEGFGTLEPQKTQDGAGKGARRNNAWRVVISVPRQQARFTFREGEAVPVGFAAWDGSRNERNGQKAYAPWSLMRLALPGEVIAAPTALPGIPPMEEEGRSLRAPIVGGVVAAAAVAATALAIWFRTRRSGAGQGKG